MQGLPVHCLVPGTPASSLRGQWKLATSWPGNTARLRELQLCKPPPLTWTERSLLGREGRVLGANLPKAGPRQAQARC